MFSLYQSNTIDFNILKHSWNIFTGDFLVSFISHLSFSLNIIITIVDLPLHQIQSEAFSPFT